MLRRKKILLIFALTAGFLAASLLANYLHTERTLESSTDCPACHFQTSSLAAGQVDLFHLPELLLLASVNDPEDDRLQKPFSPLGVSRAPPLV